MALYNPNPTYNYNPNPIGSMRKMDSTGGRVSRGGSPKRSPVGSMEMSPNGTPKGSFRSGDGTLDGRLGKTISEGEGKI
jgi:hypothetical protein